MSNAPTPIAPPSCPSCRGRNTIDLNYTSNDKKAGCKICYGIGFICDRTTKDGYLSLIASERKWMTTYEAEKVFLAYYTGVFACDFDSLKKIAETPMGDDNSKNLWMYKYIKQAAAAKGQFCYQKTPCGNGIFKMTKTGNLFNESDLFELLLNSFSTLVVNDIELFDIAASERCISSRLAHYISNRIGQGPLSCDVEYNRIVDIPKRVSTIIAEEEKSENRCVYPDIILHKRKVSYLNFSAIELKIWHENPVEKSILADWGKLVAYARELNYSYVIMANIIPMTHRFIYLSLTINDSMFGRFVISASNSLTSVLVEYDGNCKLDLRSSEIFGIKSIASGEVNAAHEALQEISKKVQLIKKYVKNSSSEHIINYQNGGRDLSGYCGGDIKYKNYIDTDGKVIKNADHHEIKIF